ncbi:MAG: riboflavin kinase [Thermoprotei archaeon]|nr:MAG: riboflavin kinase [Thermoprotei archaeon]
MSIDVKTENVDLTSIDPDLWFTLLHLAMRGGLRRGVFVSTPELAKDMGVSQQTASRRILDLESKGYIRRSVSRRGQTIVITDRGAELLRAVYVVLHDSISEALKSVVITGEVFTGLGEGAYYVSLNGYRIQIREKLGFDPYPGTLNLKLTEPSDLYFREMLNHRVGILIKGFSDGRRTYGTVKAFRATIRGINAAVLLIERTHYGIDTLEVIAPVNLREALGIKDGDRVSVEVQIT